VEYNPYRALIKEFRRIAEEITGSGDLQVIRARAGFGYLSIPLHDLIRGKPELAREVNDKTSLVKSPYLANLRFINGFLNTDVNLVNYGKLVLDSALVLLSTSSFFFSSRFSASFSGSAFASASP